MGLGSGLRRLGRRVWRVWGWVPPTPLAWLLAGGAGWALRALALAQMDYVVLIAAYGLLLLTGLMQVWVGGVAAVLAWRWRRGARAQRRPVRVNAEEWWASGFAARWVRWLPLLRVEWQVVKPSGVAVRSEWRDGGWRESLRFAARGELSGLTRRFRVQDVFGLASVHFERRKACHLRVDPAPRALGQLAPLTAMAAGDEHAHPAGPHAGERIDIRRYASGDPARLIHWKIYGRTGRLVVRTPERALSLARRTAAYLVAGPGDEASAAAARVALERGAWGHDWLFGADGCAETATKLEAAMRCIASSAAVQASAGAADLARFVATAEQTGPCALIVFAPASLGPWVKRVGALLRRRQAPLQLVVAFDQLDTAPRPKLWTRLLWRPGRPPGTPAAVLQSLAVTFGPRLMLVERSSGRHVPPATLRVPQETGARWPWRPRSAPARLV